MSNEIIQFATKNDFEEYKMDEHEMLLDIHMHLCQSNVVTDIHQAYENIMKAIKELKQ